MHIYLLMGLNTHNLQQLKGHPAAVALEIMIMAIQHGNLAYVEDRYPHQHQYRKWTGGLLIHHLFPHCHGILNRLLATAFRELMYITEEGAMVVASLYADDNSPIWY
jgi:hypothetical protein